MSTLKNNGGARNVARLAAVTGALVSLSGCQIKGYDFFTPPLTETLVVTESPKFTGESPASTLGTGPFAINSTSITLVPVAGISASQVTATANGQTVPVSVSGNTITASLAGKADGLYSITYTLPYQKTLITANYNYEIKNTPPSIDVQAPPAPSAQSNGTSIPLALSGSINDRFFYAAVGTILKPGSSNTCGNTDNTLWPQGTAPGQVSGNRWDYTSSVMANGSFGFNVSAFNPVQTGGQQTTWRYCYAVTAEDRAMDANGAPKHNISTRYFSIDETWLPQVPITFALSVSATYRHLGSTSEVCVVVSTTPPQANASAQASISGPAVIGSTSATSSLGSSGSAVIRFPISQFGTYSGSVIVGASGVTRSATFSVNVTSAAGTCT
jgi:hypothetical protein